MALAQAYQIASFDFASQDAFGKLTISIEREHQQYPLIAQGKGPIDAFVAALTSASGSTISIVEYNEHTLGEKENASAIPYRLASINRQLFSDASISSDIVRASF